MQNSKILLLTALLILAAVTVTLPGATSKSSGISATDVQTNGGCTCHSGSASSDVTAGLAGVPATYTASEVYILNITITGGPEVEANATNQGGFALKASGGIFDSSDATTQDMSDGSTTHTTAGNDQRSWETTWTAPDDDSLKVTFTLWVNAVNGNGTNDAEDHWNTVEVTSTGANYTADGDGDDKDTPGLGLVAAVAGVGLVALLAGRRRR